MGASKPVAKQAKPSSPSTPTSAWQLEFAAQVSFAGSQAGKQVVRCQGSSVPLVAKSIHLLAPQAASLSQASMQIP